MNNPRIVSFLPAATEMAYALGLGDQLVGVSHECDFPVDAKTKPVVVRCSLPVETMSLNEIDVAVAECIGRGMAKEHFTPQGWASECLAGLQVAKVNRDKTDL